MGGAERLRVEVVLADSREQHIVALEVPPGSTVMDAIRAADLDMSRADMVSLRERVGIFGRRCSLSKTLSPGDRVEIYRPLLDDPKTIRRRRAARIRK